MSGTSALDATTTPELFLRSCSDHAGSTFLIDEETSATYTDVKTQATAFASSLVRAGVEPGDRVVHWMHNGIPWAVVKFGTELAGAVHVPLSTRLRSEDAGYILAQSRARVLVVDSSAVDPALVLHLAGGTTRAEKLPTLELVIGAGFDAPGIVSLDDFRSASPGQAGELERRRAALRSDDPVNILYTSGTTGLSKGAVITHGTVIANARAGPQHIDRTAEDRWLVALPLFHTFGCVMGLMYPLSIGGSSVLLRRYSAGAAIEAIQRHRCTVLESVPTMFSDILGVPERESFDLSSWRKLYVGGAYSSETFLRRLRDELAIEEILTGYGMTEHAGLSCATQVGDPFSLVSRTIGKPLAPAFEFSIRDPRTGSQLPPGVEGEICARGPSVCNGYFDKPDETAAAFYPEGWFRSGDLGVFDSGSGYYQITGRLKELIRSGGENVSPVEIEGLLARHPAVVEAYVCGVPDERLGEVPAAFVRSRDPLLDPAELISYCRERVATFKAPRHVYFVDSFPRTASGKVQRLKLRELAAGATISAGAEQVRR